jgi:uncharacterized protein YhbP (UPF0306 family)
MSDLEKIERFIAKHHLLTLATCSDTVPWCSSAFYAYDAKTKNFIIASDEKTRHIQNALENPKVAANIHLETKEVGKIQGLQIEGSLQQCDQKGLCNLYFKAFPFAKAMRPTLWLLRPTLMKLTDNRLGFGVKLTWKRDSSR